MWLAYGEISFTALIYKHSLWSRLLSSSLHHTRSKSSLSSRSPNLEIIYVRFANLFRIYLDPKSVAMKLLSLLVSVALASGALATPTVEERGFGFPGGFEGRPSKTCLYPAAATSLVSSFKSVLTNPDRQAANATAQIIIADNFTETSDSIDTLAGYPVRTSTLHSKR